MIVFNCLQVRNEFYKGTHGALLVYDVTNRTSFESLTDWLSEMKSHTHKPSDMNDVVIAVCANKVCTCVLNHVYIQLIFRSTCVLMETGGSL